jgi:cephalosporin-C deacetylase-like acetyl esterase
MTGAVGGFPEKTPLNARITGGFARDGYRVEHLVFESQPLFYVTANVYVPTGVSAPFPAVLGVAGHSVTGKAIDTYQYAWIGLVKRGFLVVAIDPPGQGERSEYYDAATGKSTVPIGTRQHSMAGTQCLLTGTTFARYEIWDGIRAVDYLLTRGDVDAKRIAVAGNSGGGTQAAYLAVLEPRLAAAVVSCYMTDWEQLWEKPGPQDAEQNFPGFLSSGLNFGDYMIAFAPKPITMLTAIRDYFPIAGARATHAEVKRVFTLLGAADQAGYFEHDDNHGWHQPRREATYRWLTKWLQGKDDDGREPAIKPEPEVNLNATKTGQVATSLGGETVRSINLKLAERMYKGRQAARISDPDKLRNLIAHMLKLTPRSGTPPATVVSTESDARGTTTKLLLETEPGLRITITLTIPPGGAKREAMLYLNSAGVSGDREKIEALVASGTAVLAFDPRGWSRSASSSSSDEYSSEYQLAQRAFLIGRPLIGMQVYDALRAFDYLAQRPEIDGHKIGITGAGQGGVVALFAGALEPRIASVTAEGSVASYMTIARAETHAGMIGIVVPGVLREFDLPDVAGIIAPRPLQLISIRDAVGSRLPRETVQREYAVARSRYEKTRKGQLLRIDDDGGKGGR